MNIVFSVNEPYSFSYFALQILVSVAFDQTVLDTCKDVRSTNGSYAS